MADVKRKYNVETTLTAQKVCQLIDDGNINDLPLIVRSGAVLSGDIDSVTGLTSLYSSTASPINTNKCILYDTNKIFITYKDASTGYQKASILTVSDNQIIVGGSVNLGLGGMQNITLSLLETNKILAITPSAGSLRAVIITITNDVISVGTPVVLNTDSTATNLESKKLTDSTVLATYILSGNTLALIVVNVVDGVITLAKRLNYGYTVSAGQLGLEVFDKNHALLVYQDGNTYPNASLIGISDLNVLSYSAPVQINAFPSFDITSAIIDSTHALVSSTADHSGYGMDSTVITFNGSSISVGTRYNFGVYSTYTSCVKIDSKNFMIVSQGATAGLHFYVLRISENYIITKSTTVVSGSVVPVYTFTCRINETSVFGGASEPSGNTLNGAVAKLVVSSYAEPRNGKVIGVSLDTAGNVQLKGKCKALTGLIPGSKYYFDANGVISTTATGTFLGVALSAAELSIPDYLIS